MQTLPSNFLHDFTLKAWSDPRIKIKVVHGTHKELLTRLNNDEVDLILSDTPLGRSSRVYRSVHLGQQPLLVVGTKEFAGLKKNFPYSLDGSPCLSMGFSGHVQSELEYFFKINSIQPDFIGQIDDLALMQIAAENSYCVSVLPEQVARRSLKGAKMIKIGEISEVSLHFWLITTQLGGKKVLIKKLINQFIKRAKDT